jgi:catalase
MYLLEKIMHLDRERIPERVVHAKGGLGLDLKEAERLAKMSHEERAKATAK